MCRAYHPSNCDGRSQWSFDREPVRSNCQEEVYSSHCYQHVHEVIGSVCVAEICCIPHIHHFATISDIAIPCGNGCHVHKVCFETECCEGHCHDVYGYTQPASDFEKHVHFLVGTTQETAGHCHDFRLSTLPNIPVRR